jgi:hypothetical protein
MKIPKKETVIKLLKEAWLIGVIVNIPFAVCSGNAIYFMLSWAAIPATIIASTSDL